MAPGHVAVGVAITLAYSLLACRADALLLGEVTCGRPKLEGLKGITGGCTAPPALACPAAWCASAAGPRPPDKHPTVLLELKGHLEDSLRNGARLLRGDDQPSAELPNTHSP